MEYQSCEFELKSNSDADGVGTFKGYASTFGNTDLVGDIIKSGAFAKSIKVPSNILMLWNHSSNDVIGGFTAMEEDSKGLLVEGELNLDVQRGREAYALLKKKHIKSMSVGFRIPKNGAEFRTDGIREISKADLAEVSLVAMPANPKAAIRNVKSQVQLSVRQFERELMEAEFSKSNAATIISLMKRHFDFANADERDAVENQIKRDADLQTQKENLNQLRDALAGLSLSPKK